MATDTPTVAVYWYSQTGQLREAAEAFVAPLSAAGWQVQWREVRPRTPYPFPWSVRRFVGLFPEAADRAATVDVDIEQADGPAVADLVVFAFQVWYLAPSVPMRSAPARAPAEFRDRPVIGLTACRNMWYSAALQVHELLSAAGADYLGTVSAIDSAPAGATFVTTLRWLLTGRREAFLGFPRAGVGPDELNRLSRAGARLAAAPAGPEFAAELRAGLRDSAAARIEPGIAAADLLAGKVFRSWSHVVRRAGAPLLRVPLLTLFALWLGAAVAAGLPAVILSRLLARDRFDAAVLRRLGPALAGGTAAPALDAPLPGRR